MTFNKAVFFVSIILASPIGFFSRYRVLLSAFLVLLISVLFTGNSFGQSVNTNSGTDFWFGFTETDDLQSADYVVYINTLKKTNGTVSVPGAAWSTNFTAVPGLTTRIVVPSADVVVASFNAPTNQAVNVVADSNVSVFAAIEFSERSDNTCILPVSLLGNEYYIMDFTLCQSFSEFMVVAQGCKDSVEIIPTGHIVVGGDHPAGVPYTVVLQPGQVFLVQSDTDLTGSIVKSLNHSETGVIAGSNWNCSYCNGTANPFYEEQFPINAWGENFVFLPTSQAQDQCRVMAQQNGTTVTFYTAAGNNVQTLNAGQYYDTTVAYSSPVFINGTNPISVGRFLRTGQCNNYYITNPTGKGDPAEVMEDATEQMFLDTITFYVSRTPDIDSTYIQVVTRTADVNKIFLDNVNIGAFFNTLVPNPTYAYTSLTILPGSHTLTTTGQGFVAYTCGLGFEDAMAADAGVYLQEIKINVTGNSPSSCLASDGNATANVSGIPPYLYLWNNGETTQTATGLSAGIYTVTVTDSDCVPHKATASIIINGKNGYSASVTDTNPGCQYVYGKSTAYPTGGTAPYTYSWSNNETNQTATGLSAGSYTCTITDNTGCKCFVVTNIISYLPPGIGIAPYNDSSCGPPNDQLHVYGLNTGIYHWAPNSGLSCNVCPSPTATPTVTTTYTISGADSNGCTASTTITLTVLNTPKPLVRGQDSICQGSPDTLIVTGGSTYQWSNNLTTDSIVVSPATTTIYTVTASNGYCPSNDTTFKVYVLQSVVAKITPPQDSVCQGDSVKLIASGGTKYKWSTGSTLSNIWVKSAGTYTVYVSASQAACSDSATIKIKMIPHTTASISVNDTVCPNDTVTITAMGMGGQVTYRWNTGATTQSIKVNDTVTTTYTATVYGICDSTIKTMTLTVIPLPKPEIKGSTWKCKGVDDTLTVSSSVNPTTYVWNNGATTATIITGGINTDTTIYITAYNSIGCPMKYSFPITVQIPPNVTINPPTVACSGSPVLLRATAKGTGPFTYTWSPGGQTTDTVTVNPASSTSYSVVVSNGCPVTKTTVVIPDNPALSACCDNRILLGDDTVMVAHGSSSKPYVWSPPVNCLNPPICDSVQVTPTVTTTYTVTMTDSSGCQLERIVTILVETRCFDFIVPNVFTPANAGTLGLNNIFYVKTEHKDTWSLTIFDRWGKEMFNTTNPDAYWTGNAEGGGQAPAGVYYYIINAACQNTTYKKDGFVQLIR